MSQRGHSTTRMTTTKKSGQCVGTGGGSMSLADEVKGKVGGIRLEERAWLKEVSRKENRVKMKAYFCLLRLAQSHSSFFVLCNVL